MTITSALIPTGSNHNETFMMNFLKQYQTIFIFILIVVVLYGGYAYFFSAPTSAPLTTEVAPQVGLDQDLIALLFQLKAIRLDASIFDDPTYKSLVDFGRDLVPEPVGRPNPFAPLTGSASAGASAAPKK